MMSYNESFRREKEIMKEIKQFMKDEAHSSYDIFTGSREFTKVTSGHILYNHVTMTV